VYFDESKHPRDKNGRFTDNVGSDYAAEVNERIRWAKDNGIELPLNADGSLDDVRLQKLYAESKSERKMTPAEKIASVHIDFEKDNILPELNAAELQKIGASKNKPVLLKKSIIDRNAVEHYDLTNDDVESIIKNALYDSPEVFRAHKDKPYYHFAKVIEINSKEKPEIGLALLDVDDKKDNFEVVHAYFVGNKAFERAKKKG